MNILRPSASEYADGSLDGFESDAEDFHDDQVASVYLGKTGGPVQRQKLRARVDWMLERQHGSTALDIGCSQGMLTLLLARQGVEAVGVDINPRAVASAWALVAEEPQDVQARVTFLRADVMREPSLPAQTFQTVYLGEIIEHSEVPGAMIAIAAARVSDGGRLVITTPHGYLPHDDHKQAFALSDLVGHVPPSLSITEIDVVHGYVRICCEKDGGGRPRPSDQMLLELAERSLVDQQTTLHKMLRTRGRTVAQLTDKLDHHTKEVAMLKLRLSELEKAEQEKASRLLKITKSVSYTVAREFTDALAKPFPGVIKLPVRLFRLAQKQRSKTKKHVFEAFEPLKTKSAPGLSVVGIVDEFTQQCFQHEWNLTLLDRKNWRQEIEKAKPAFLFVESAWRGNGGAWNYTLTKFEPTPAHPLHELILHCRKIGLPTVYWGKEDPPNFDVFKAAAKEFDYIFTSDADCIPRYREICGHDRVYALPFAAQPVLHNPARRRESIDRQVAFGGGWYNDKHPARQKYLPELLEATQQVGLKMTIFDRFSELRGPESHKHRFPEAYTSHVRPKLPYDRMLSAYRMFPTFLNVNSVAQSPTMFSRRVFELLACGTNVVSSPSTGMVSMLQDVVLVAADAEKAKQALLDLHADPVAAKRRAHLGYRAVMREHTYAARAADVVAKVAPGLVPPPVDESVTVILTTNRPDRLSHALDNFRRQKHAKKELILVLNSDAFARGAVEAETSDIPGVKIFRLPERATLATCLNYAVDYADGRYWAKFDDDDVYGEEYLGDALLPFSFTDAAIVGKGTYFARITGEPELYLRRAGNQHKYAQLICGGTLVLDREQTKSIRFDETIARGADTDFLKRAQQAGCKVYSADPYNFIQVRGIDPNRHTWTINRADYLKSCTKIADSDIEKHVFF